MLKRAKVPSLGQINVMRDQVYKTQYPVMVERLQRGAGLSLEDAKVAAHIAFGVLGFTVNQPDQRQS